MEEDNIKTEIKVFFSRFFNADALDDSQDIFVGGYVNSLFAMQLIAWLEKKYEFSIDDSDLQMTNFNTVNAIADLIVRKRPTTAVV